MATYNTSFIVNLADLTRILDNIKIAEQHAAGGNLVDIIGTSSALLPMGLRTVDGSFNNLLPGQEQVGAADGIFPRLLTPDYRNDGDGDTVTLPGGGPTITRTNYDPTIVTASGTHSVADADPRIISNLISDQTLGNQAALQAALLLAGSTNIADDMVAINAKFALFKAAVTVATVKQHTEHEYENAKAGATTVDTQTTAAQNALTALLGGIAGNGDPVDQADLDNSTAAVAAANAAVAAQLDVVKALQSDINIAPADLASAQTLLGNLQNLKAAVLAIAADLGDGTVDAFAAIQTAESDATTFAGTATTNLGTLTGGEATAENASILADADLATKKGQLETVVTGAGLEMSADGSIAIEARSPDVGLSPPNSGWMTLFGQFFDHGLDLVTKGGNGTIYMPIDANDPLYDKGRDGIVGANPNTGLNDDGFGADGVFNTADDSPNFMALKRVTPFIDPATGQPTEAQNTTTPFVDQNQTYTSNSSHQVFLREYAFSVDTDNNNVADSFAVNTGRLLNGANGGIANWGEVKAQAAEKLGLILSDFDVHDVPLLKVDAYGKFEAGANGFAQVAVFTQEYAPNPLFISQLLTPSVAPFIAVGQPTQVWVEGTATGLNLAGIPNTTAPDINGHFLVTLVGHTGHAFLNDIAHHAAPSLLDLNHDGIPETRQVADADPGVGDDHNLLTYDDEMLNAHFVTGDGRGNENIGLTAVHTIFHSEHNRLVEVNKATLIADAQASGNTAFLNEWLATDVATVPNDLSTLVWDGERLFQAARFVTEMQYQHLVFEEFARRVQPNVDPFVFTNSAELNPAIVAEFAHAVYRFGHSQLTDTVDRLDNNLGNVNGDPEQIGLIEAFLNPQEFTASGIDDEAAAGAIIRGMSRQVGNEIDEFIVESLRNNLLGLPLDLGALNIARGRETGIPSLNDARAELYAGTGQPDLKPYISWLDFAQNIKHPMSVVNFIAAYGTHEAITSAATLADKRAAATLLVLGDGTNGNGVTIGTHTYSNADRLAFLNGTDGYAGGASAGAAGSHGGLNDVDMWIGGLAEEIKEFGGMLGSTFNYVFEYQMEHLQNGDRFYYLSRTQGMNLLNLLEANTFSDIIMRNTDLGDVHATHLSAEIMEVPDMILELDSLVHQENYSGNAALDGQDPLDRSELDVKWDDPFQQAVDPKVVRDANYVLNGLTYNELKFSGGEHVVLGGTEGNDALYGDKGIDTLWGDGGNDYLNAGMESDQVFGGDGDDIIEDPFGDDFLRGEAGDDVIVNGSGLDILFGGTGQDFIMAVTDITEVFAGPGNDFLLGGSAADGLMGNEGDDWIEGGEGFDGLSGENSELFFNSAIVGHDILWGQGNDTDYDGENGDDIMVQSAGIQRNNGMEGFDWAIHKGDEVSPGVASNAVSDLSNFLGAGAVTPAFILRDRFDSVEGLSGWDGNDTLSGASKLIVAGGGFDSKLTQAGVDRIDGLKYIIGSAALQPDSLGGIGADPTLGNAPNTVVLTSDHAHDGGEIILGGAGNDIMMGALGDDIMDGDAWLNIRISVHQNKVTSANPGPEIFTVNSLTEVISGTGNNAWDGHSVADLMRTGVINPGQLQAVREVLNSDGTRVSDTGGSTDDGTIDINGVFHGNVDIAVFRDIRANYIVETDLNGIAGDFDGDGFIKIVHTPPAGGGGGGGGGGNKLLDGTDFIRNFEVLKFADMTQIIQLGLTNDIASGSLVIAETNGAAPRAFGTFEVGDTFTIQNVLGITDADGVPDISKFTFTWQFEQTPGQGDWADITDPVTGEVITGTSFTPTFAFGLDGLSIRVAGNFTDLHGIPETVFSASSAPLVGTAPVGPEPPVALGALLPAVDPAGDPVPPATIGIFEDAGPLTITRAQLLTGVTDLDTPIANLAVSNLAIRIRPGDPNPGTLTGPDINGNWTYTPAPDFNGGLVLTFDVSDGTNPPVPLEATLEVLPVNDVPLEAADVSLGTTLAGAGATPVTFTTADIFANFTGVTAPDVNGDRFDIDGDTVTLITLAPNSVVLANPADGTLTDNLDGTFTFVANPGFNGNVVVNFQITDGTGSANDPAVSGTVANSVITLTNSAATGNALVIDANGGTPTEGQALTLNTAAIVDANGIGPFGFQWQSAPAGSPPNGAWTNILAGAGNGTGQTTANYTPGNNQVGLILRAVVSYTDGGGTLEQVFSAPTSGVGDLITSNAATITGTAFDDDITGGIAANTINGQAGSDILRGGLGNDTLNGDAGNDSLVVDITLGLSGADTLSGGADTDTLSINGSALLSDTLDVAFNGTGITQIEGGGSVGADIEIITADLGGGVNDRLDYTGTTAGVTVNLGAGTASGFTSIANIENATGGVGADTLIGSGGNNALNGGGGNDTIDGGAGDDNITYAVTVAAGNITSGRDLVDGNTNNVGGPPNTTGDRFTLTGIGGTTETFKIMTRAQAQANLSAAQLGTLQAGTEIVVVRQTGAVANNNFANAVILAELDNIEELTINNSPVSIPVPPGAAGGDTIQIIGTFNTTSLNFNTITIDGDADSETVDISQLTSDHRIVFNTGGGNDTLVGPQRVQDVINRTTSDPFNIVGTSGGDSISGSDDKEHLSGGGGDDNLNSGGGDDEMDGGSGNDKMNGGSGNDQIHGGSGKDSINGGTGAERVWGGDDDDRFIVTAGDGNDWYAGGSGSDFYDARSVSNNMVINLMTGSATGAGTDTLHSFERAWSGSGNDSLTGNNSNNYLIGGAGADSLSGLAGNDYLNGGSGHDTLNGGTGGDWLTGGEGNDKFVFSSGFGNDAILDFDANAAGGQDKIDLSALGISATNFEARVDIIDKGGDVLIRVDDTNTIKLKDVANVHDVTINDFVLFGG